MAGARILIAGGSLGGLLAANLLLRAGHAVTVLEKAAGSLDGRGAGIVTHRALLQALRDAGVTVDDTLGVTVQQRVVLDASGATVARRDCPQLLTSWSRLYTLLAAALPAGHLHSGQAVQRVDQDADGVRVHCADGAVHHADLLLASDGLRSSVRGQLAPEVQPQYAGYVAWRGVCDEARLSAATRATLFEHFAFGLPEGEQVLGYPVAGAGNATEPGRRRYNFVWYRPADAARTLPALMTDDDGQHHPLGVPPHKVGAAPIAAMRAAAHALLAPQWVEVIAQTAQPFLQPIFDLASPQLAFDRVALMGDAAFVARPHVGMGVTKAAEDAQALVAAIAAHGATPVALAAYQARRLVPGQAVVARARALGAYLQAQTQTQSPTPDPSGRLAPAPGRARLPPLAAPRDAQAVMRETAIDLGAQPSDIPLALA